MRLHAHVTAATAIAVALTAGGTSHPVDAAARPAMPATCATPATVRNDTPAPAIAEWRLTDGTTMWVAIPPWGAVSGLMSRPCAPRPVSVIVSQDDDRWIELGHDTRIPDGDSAVLVHITQRHRSH